MSKSGAFKGIVARFVAARGAALRADWASTGSGLRVVLTDRATDCTLELVLEGDPVAEAVTEKLEAALEGLGRVVIALTGTEPPYVLVADSKGTSDWYRQLVESTYGG